jgi:aminopeptidase N
MGIAPVLHALHRCAVLLTLAAALSAWAQPRFDLGSTQTVLPTTVLPRYARLDLDVDPSRATFRGDVTHQVDVLEPVQAITLHAVQLAARSAQLLGGPQPRPLRVNADAKAGLWRLVPTDGQPIAAGAWRIRIRYQGQIQLAGEGLYRVDLRVQGRPARMLATQLEAVQARRVLPVFDEPVFRSVFELSVLAPRGYEVLSNMPRRAIQPVGGALRHIFAPTPPMPSYLLAVAVGRFDVLEGSSGETSLRILTAPGKREQARFAMEVTQQVLPFYTQYFGRPYALPKLDQLAVPGTRQGAMEDWGLISYVEDALLYDPARSSPDTQRGVFAVVAHEIAHQWFGNLVSVASWDEIWLNEAFATWLERKAMAHFHPEWHSELRGRGFVAQTMQRDASAATRAIRGGPVSEASVFEVFDNITYTKGGAVLTMIEQWIGAEAFQRGLAAYMAERAFKPATAGDLWFHIGRATGQPVAEMAASWTDQPGIPLVSLEARCEAGNTQVTLRQSRFSLGDPLAGGPWRVPVQLARADDSRIVVLDAEQASVPWPGCGDEPLRANAGGKGYYVVAYSPAMRARLTAGFAALSPADRVTLVSDSFALATAGRQPMADHLDLLASLPLVDDASRPALFKMAATHWRQLDRALHDTAVQVALRAAGRALFGPELARVGWQSAPGEDSEIQTLRADLIEILTVLDDAPTMDAARQRFAVALDPSSGELPAAIRGPVLAAVGRHATEAEFESLMSALRRSESEEERWLLMDALASGQDRVRAQRLLDEALSGRLPPSQSTALPGRVGDNPALVSLAYRFVLAHWDALARLAGDGPFGGRHWLLPSSAGSSSEPAMAQQLLLDQHRLAGTSGASSAQRMAASIQARHRLREREAEQLPGALSGWAPRASAGGR